MTSNGQLPNLRPCVQGPFGQPTAVMFVDLDHFMRICIDASADVVFALLRGDFQRIVTDAVFGFKGELNAYQGDGVLATFGELPGRADCASRTLQCALKILQQISALNLDRRDHGVVSACIGLQYGQVWTGTTGITQRFGPTLIGDAVNVAVKLEQFAHSLETKIVAGDEFMQMARREQALDTAELAQFTSAGPLHLVGRREPIGVWTLQKEAAELLLESGRARCASAYRRGY